MPDENGLLGTAEACRVLEVDKSTLTRWVGDGTIAAVHKLPGRNGAFVFDRAEVDRLAAERAVAESEATEKTQAAS